MKPRAFAPVLTFLSLAVSLPAAAESEPWLVRDTLTDGWFGLAEPLAERGIDFDLSTTGYYAGLLSGTGDEDFEWGGRADAFLKIDTAKAGLWEGGGIHVHAESRFTNIAFVAPPSGVVPPTIMGMVLRQKMDDFTLTFMAFDPDDRTGDYWVSTTTSATTSSPPSPARCRWTTSRAWRSITIAPSPAGCA